MNDKTINDMVDNFINNDIDQAQVNFHDVLQKKMQQIINKTPEVTTTDVEDGETEE